MKIRLKHHGLETEFSFKFLLCLQTFDPSDSSFSIGIETASLKKLFDFFCRNTLSFKCFHKPYPAVVVRKTDLRVQIVNLAAREQGFEYFDTFPFPNARVTLKLGSYCLYEFPGMDSPEDDLSNT